jgi:hypothetical protein
MKIGRMSKQCEHTCTIGKIDFYAPEHGYDTELLLDGDVKPDFKEYTVVLFNFCPGCGQELYLEKEEKDGKIKFFRSKGN